MSTDGAPAAFLDRDGTLNVDPGYLADPAALEVIPSAPDAVARLVDAGFVPVVLTNQSGVARGRLDEATLARIHERLQRQLGGRIRAFLHCPHHPTAGDGPYTRGCACRKPGPGLFRAAIELFGLDPRRSIAIGDSARDLLPALELGARGVLVETGKPVRDGLASLAAGGFAGVPVAADIGAAVDRLLGDAGGAVQERSSPC